MMRLASTISWDLRLQFRQGIHAAAIIVVVVWAVILSQAPTGARAFIAPLGVFVDLSAFGVYFMAGILYFEKGERVLEALAVSPLRRGEYLAAKVVSLTLLGVVMTVAVMALGYGLRLGWLQLLGGAVLNSWVMCLSSFILAARYNSISEFLLPSVIYMAPLQLPLLDYFGIWAHWIFYLLPTQATLILIEAAYRPVPLWEQLYAVGYLSLAALILSAWAAATYDRFVVRKEQRHAL